MLRPGKSALHPGTHRAILPAVGAGANRIRLCQIDVEYLDPGRRTVGVRRNRYGEQCQRRHDEANPKGDPGGGFEGGLHGQASTMSFPNARPSFGGMWVVVQVGAQIVGMPAVDTS